MTDHERTAEGAGPTSSQGAGEQLGPHAQRLIRILGLMSAVIWIGATFIESLIVDSFPGPMAALAIVGGPLVGAAIPWLAYPFLTRRRGQT